MARASAAGEQDALRGYGYQYDHIAMVVHDLYVSGRGFELRLVDPEAGAVDDCVLVLQPDAAGGREEVRGYQYKSAPGNLTLATLLTEERDRRAQPKPCLLAQLIIGWRTLKSRYGERDVTVHLVTPGDLSVHDRPLSSAAKALGVPTGHADVPSPQHTAAFFAWVRQSLAAGQSLEDTAPGWGPVLPWVRSRTELAPEETTDFFSALRVESGTLDALPPVQQARGQRPDDIRQLAEVLRRRVQESRRGEPVVLMHDDVALLAGFGTRGRLRHSHRFPVDLDRYTPLLGAQQALTAAIDQIRQGYVAVVGTPGSGKSTLLSQATPGLVDRVVTYLTFMPGDPAATGRASAADFLHDLVLELEGAGLGNRNSLPERDINELRLRLRDLLAEAALEFTQTGRRTLLVIDGLDHVARLSLAQTLLAELPAPDAVPDGVVIVLGSQTIAMLDQRIQHHLTEAAGGGARIVDLTLHRLTAAAVEESCERLAKSIPGLRLSASQVARVVDLVAGHPLALGYVFNALTDLIDGQQQAAGSDDADEVPVVPAEEIGAALDGCVRYSGNVADDYAAYLADADDSDALRELLGDLARLRSPMNMEWVLSWASPAASSELRHVRHLFRRLDSHSWMFFHDSFRRFVLESTSVDVLGEPDDSADARRHSFLADQCATAPAESRERGEEFFHSARAGLDGRAVTLATPGGFRGRFLSGISPDVVAEDLRLAMRLTAAAGDAAALTGLMLLQSELRARQDALGSVDVAGLYLDAGEQSAAVTYALPDGILRIPPAQAMRAAVRLDALGNPAGRLLFDAADAYNPAKRTASSDHQETLSAWTEAAVRFRPSTVLHTTVRRLLDQAMADLTSPRDDRGSIDAWQTGRNAVYVAWHAASELWRLGRDADALALTRELEDRAETLLSLAGGEAPGGDAWGRRLANYAYSALAGLRIARASVLVGSGQWDDALTVLQSNGRDAPAGAEGTLPWVGTAARGHAGDAAALVLQIALATSREEAGPATSSSPLSGPTGDGGARTDAGAGAAAVAYASKLLEGLGSPASIVSADLSSSDETSGIIAKAVQERSCHMLKAGLAAQSAGQPVTEELLQDGLPPLARPPANQPAGAGIDPAAAIHSDYPAIEYAARLDIAVSNLALLKAAISLSAFPAATLRALVVRATSSLPSLPNDLTDAVRARPLYARYLELLIDVAAQHSGELASYAGERIEAVTDPSRLGGRRGSSVNRYFLRRLRQRLGLRLLEHDVRVPWLDQAISDADLEITASPGAYEHVEALATQINAHALGGDFRTARELLARVIPESFTPSWSRDSQLTEWVRWLLTAGESSPDTLPAKATDIAPMLAALTEATDGAAEDAGALLLEGLASVAPQPAVRLAAWQLGQGALSFAEALESLVSGFATALINAINGEPETATQADDAVALLSTVMAGILAPVGRIPPRRALERISELLSHLSPEHAAGISEQAARAVDIHVLPGLRDDWRRALDLPATPTSTRDAADKAAPDDDLPPEADDHRWGTSEYGQFKAADGSLKKPHVVLQSVTDLSSALAWRATQAEAGTFSWLPVLEPIISRAGSSHLEQVADGFSSVYDASAIFVAVARRLQEIGDANAASSAARQAISGSEPAAWSRNHGNAVRRQAWHLLTARGDESACREALRDLAELLVSADYWPGQLMLELRQILPVVAPSTPAARIWEQVEGHLHEMRAGLTEPSRPALDGPVRATWWAPAEQEPKPTRHEDASGPSEQHPRNPASVGAALTDLVIMSLDHPMWTVREGAAAVLAWQLRHGGSLVAVADARASAVLASTDDRPVLAAALSLPASEASPASEVLQPNQMGAAEVVHRDGEGLGGDAVREMTARATAAADDAGSAGPSSSLATAGASGTWIAARCALQARPGMAVPRRPRPLPAAYQLSIPTSPGRGLDPRNRDIDMGPYGARAEILAQAAGLSPNAVLHRLWRLTELAQRVIPDAEATDRAARATRIDGLLSTATGLALRAAFGAVVAELIDAGRLSTDDEELAPVFEMVDLGLVRQPISPIPGWVSVPLMRKWIPDDAWLSAATGRLAEYEALQAMVNSTGSVPDSWVTLTSDSLSGASIEFGPIAAVIGADHQFSITEQGRPTERYLLASTFGAGRPRQASFPPSGILIPPARQPKVSMISVEDWLLADGTTRNSPESSPASAMRGQPLIVNTDSAALQTNAAHWTCLNPEIASRYGWLPHPTQPLCWQDADGSLTAATVIWHLGTIDARRGSHETVGEGSAVIVTPAGLRALANGTNILRVHQIVRTVGGPTRSRHVSTGELPPLEAT